MRQLFADRSQIIQSVAKASNTDYASFRAGDRCHDLVRVDLLRVVSTCAANASCALERPVHADSFRAVTPLAGGAGDLQPIEMTGVQTRISAEEEQALLKVLREGTTLAVGPEGEAFEREFTAFIGCADAVAVNSCSSALELAALMSGTGPGDEVIVPAHTFVSAAVPFARSGAMIQWADIDPDTALISVHSVERLIRPSTKVVVVVHLYGLPADLDAILSVCGPHGITVIEDCAQAPGAFYHGRRVGSIGHFGCFSFHTHKNISTLGEGGMLTVRDADDGIRARRLRWMGNWTFEGERDRFWLPAATNVVEPIPGRWPINACLGEPNAAVGRVALRRLDAINEGRRRQADRLIVGLANYPELVFQPSPPDRTHVRHLMPVRYAGRGGASRDDLIELLFSEYRLKTAPHYWPLNRTPLFQAFGFGEAEVPETDAWFDNMLGLPWWSDMGNALIDDMISRIAGALDRLRC